MPRPLLLQLQVSADMYMAASDSSLSFLGTQWSSDLNAYVARLMTPVDGILMGHNLAKGFIPHWLARPSHESAESIDKMNACSKFVFSQRTSAPDDGWNAPGGGRVVVLNGDLASEVRKLKAADGGSLIAYGGVQFVQSLLSEEGLVDEVALVINPAVLGEGKKVFPKPGNWELIDAQRFECGLAVLKWRSQTITGQ